MAVLELPAGINATVGIHGKPGVNFISYGLAVSATEQSFTATNKRMAVLIDSTAPDSIQILTQPDEGRVIARSDGGISYDLNEVSATGEQKFTYRRNNGGAFTDVTATVTLVANARAAGWGLGDYYYLELDDSDAFVVGPDENARLLHVATDGLSAADIQARNGSSLTAAGLNSTSACDEAGNVIVPNVLYGETEALALDEAEALKLYQYQVGNHNFASWWVLYKRGQTFTNPANLVGVKSRSKLHPSYIGGYGTGTPPKFDTVFSATSGATWGVVIQGVDYGYNIQHQNCAFLAMDDVFCDGSSFPASISGSGYPIGGGGVDVDGFKNRGITARRARIRDCVQTIPTSSSLTWAHNNGDRISGFYEDDTAGSLREKIYVDQIAWQHGYRADKSKDFPKSPDNGSHGAYLQSDCLDVSVRDVIFTNPNFNGIQARSGTILQRCFTAYANAGVFFGNGDLEDIDGVSTRYTTLSYGSDIIVTEAGEKDGYQVDGNEADGFQAILAGGIQNEAADLCLNRATVIHGGERGTAISGPEDIGPVGRVGRASETYSVSLAKIDKGGSWWKNEFPNCFIYNWSPSYLTGSDTTGLNTTALDALSTGGFNDQWKSTTGSDFADFVASLREETAPWTHLPALLEYYQSETGQWVTPRTAATTVTFEPAASGGTPGFRSDVTDDWSTNDLPGAFSGDSIHLDGYRVFWNIPPANTIKDLTLGDGGTLWMRGGALDVTGTVHTPKEGGKVYVRGGATFKINTVSDGALDVLVTDGRFQNTGTLSGDVSVKAVCGGEALLCGPDGAFTLSSGQTLTIGGYGIAGGDGISGGTGTVALASGSTTRFQVDARIFADGLVLDRIAVPYATITGDTNGTTAIVDEHYRTASRSDIVYTAYDLTGTFADDEPLSGSEVLYNAVQLTDTGATEAGVVNGAPEVALGQIRKFRSGVHGFTPTNMALSITLGGTLEIDMAGYEGAVTHTLIEADLLTGAFSQVRVLNLGERDATVTVRDTTVTLEVTTGGSADVTVI